MLEGEPEELLAEAFGDQMEVEVVVGSRLDEPQIGRLRREGLSPGRSAEVWACLDRDGYARAARLAPSLAASGVLVKEIRVHRPSLAHLLRRTAECDK